MRKRGARIQHVRRDVTPFIRMFGNRSGLPKEHARTIGIAHHMALEAIKGGSGTDSNMAQLAYALNLAMTLCEVGVGADLLDFVTAAQDELQRVDAVSRGAGHWLLDENAYRTICVALEVHDQQIEQASQAQIREGEEIIKGRLAEGRVVRVEVSERH
jgi:hypothetical protein